MGVMDGTVTTAADYLKQIARQFGGFVHQRDEPMNTELRAPDKLSPYNERSLQDNQGELEYLLGLSSEEVVAARDSSYREAVDRYHEHNREAQEARERYERMREKVSQWNPPTAEHEGIKKLALEQLDQSIMQDCNTSWNQVPTLEDPEVWLSNRVGWVQEGIERDERRIKDSEVRYEKQTSWVESFLASLPPG